MNMFLKIFREIHNCYVVKPEAGLNIKPEADLAWAHTRHGGLISAVLEGKIQEQQKNNLMTCPRNTTRHKHIKHPHIYHCLNPRKISAAKLL